MASRFLWFRISNAEVRFVKLFCGVACLVITTLLASRSIESSVRCFPSRARLPVGETLHRWAKSQKQTLGPTADDIRSALEELVRASEALNRIQRLEGRPAQTAVVTALAALEKVRLHLEPTGKTKNGSSIAQKSVVRVCPEYYVNTTVGYPFFYDGWRTKPCPLRHGYSKLVTVLLTLASKSDVPRIQRVLVSLNKTYPDLRVLLGVPEGWSNSIEMIENVQLVRVEGVPAEDDMLNALFKAAETEYVLVGADLDDFSSDGNVERLLREAERQRAAVVAGALRRSDGRWSHGCFQVSAVNYSLGFIPGYRRSQHECLYCDHVSGPFLGRTELLRQVLLQGSFQLWQEHLFLQLPKVDAMGGAQPVLVCPDVMFHVRDRVRDTETTHSWLEMAREMQVLTIRPPDGAVVHFTCKQLGLVCTMAAGEVLSPCCRSDLLQLIHETMALCADANAICELQEGTLLGALKMGSILPWERDADIAVSSSHFQQLFQSARAQHTGITLRKVSAPYCCFEGRQSGGVGKVQSASGGWVLELWGQHWMDTEKLRDEQYLTPTRVLLDGRWYPAPRNPGLYVRNRYGHEVYRHAEHWIDTGLRSGWGTYNTGRFVVCRRPGHHSCVDQYQNDGVLQFDRSPIGGPH